MSKKSIGLSIVILGALILFSSEENAWIVSSVFLGVGSGIFFWKE
jgi:hypothetical protein